MSEATTQDETRLRRAALFGTVAGFRALLPLGLMARAIDAGELAPATGQLSALLRSPQARIGLQIAALGETVVDKLPILPGRIRPAPLLGRVGFGALAAIVLADEIGAPLPAAAARGATGAGLAAVAGYSFRVLGTRLTGLPDLIVALAEDVIAVRLGQTALQGETAAGQRRDGKTGRREGMTVPDA